VKAPAVFFRWRGACAPAIVTFVDLLHTGRRVPPWLAAKFARDLCLGSLMPDPTHDALDALQGDTGSLADDTFLREAAAISEPATDELLPQARLHAGDVLSDRFVIERLAGAGGMGAVYLASDRLSGTSVALKVMTARGEHRERFAQEVRVLAGLEHPTIVRYVAHGTTSQGQPYMAMEWLDGEDLAQRLVASRLNVEESLQVARRVGEALATAHARGIVHRDVKPSNVFLPKGEPSLAKLIDFGIVRMDLSGVAPTAMPMTRTGAVMGTVGYMSPEQAIGEPNLDSRADVFALGCVLFECLTGAPVFSGDHVVAVLAKVLREEAPRLRDTRPDLPAALDALVARMLSKERARRPQHGSSVLRELDALGTIAGGAPEQARRLVGLSGTEQRMTSVILVAAAGESKAIGDVIRGHGGEFARLANGALLITLGGRGAASEQVMVGAGCALDMRAALPAARIVMATGRALMGAAGTPGPVIDQAASLLAHPSAPGIRLDAVTARLLEERFEVQQDGPHALLVGRRVEVETARTLLGRPTPFVGREKELALLEGTLRECIDESVARAMLVTGPAGQGKSRLCREFVRKTRAHADVKVLTARADPVGAGSSFMLVRQLVRQAVGLREGDPAREHYEKLRAHVAVVCPGQDSGRIADFLGELLEVPSTDTPSPQLRAARNDATIMAGWIGRSFGDWLVAECKSRALLVVLEDLHWGDVPSVTYLGEGLRTLSAAPFMVLALGRPELHETFPSLWVAAEKSEVSLGRLAPRAAERLVRAALGGQIAGDAVARVVEQADGNAFYLEELIRRVADGAGDTLPETVLALVQSRIERLEPEARRIVRAASVFGEVFWRGGVASLLGGARDIADLDAWLKVLADREMVSIVRDCRYPSESEFTFRHGLLREGAYAMLTDADRTTGHRLAGAWLERAGEKDALTMADHFERGGESKRAVPWLLRAAASAFDGGNMQAANDLAQRGLDCRPETAERGELLRVQGNVLYMRGDWLASARVYQALMDVLPMGSTAWFSSAAAVFASGVPALVASAMQAILMAPVQPEPSGPYGVAVHTACTGLSGVGQEALAWSFLERAEQVEKSASDPDPVFVLWQAVTRAELLLWRGELGRALAMFSETCGTADRIGAAAARATSEVYMVAILSETGHFDRTEKAALSTLGLHGDWTKFYLNSARLDIHRAGSLDELRSQLTRLDRNPVLALAVRARLAVALVEENDLDAAVGEAQEVLRNSPGFAMATPLALAAMALVALRRNEPDQALASADSGLAVLGSRLASTVSLLRVLRAQALHVLGRIDDAKSAIREARDRILRIAATLDDFPELRESYLTNVEANANTLKLAREWLPELASEPL
jgi:tetratricopeptide (TPR) repeat protein